MRLTIERMRTLVIAAGLLLVVALVGFLAIGRWKSHITLKEIPKRLGANIQQEANDVVYTQAHSGHTLFKIQASKEVQLKESGLVILHNVRIELYGEDGTRVDRIAGNEFEYDQKNGKATAAGPVEITLMRPGEAPAVAPKAVQGRPPKATPLGSATQRASQGEIQVETSGLTFDQKSGIATTAQKVQFALTQGKGKSVGATFDSGKGQLVLDHSVEMDIGRGAAKVLLHAQHAEFERDNLLCRMHAPQGSFRGEEASAGDATLLFRPDGSAVRLDATNGFSMATAKSAHIAAPTGWLEFNEHNQPTHGRLEGGATMDSSSNGRQVRGASPTADLAFTPQGVLQRVRLERGVSIHSDETTAQQSGETVKVSRDWRSPVADMEFRSARQRAKGRVELASVTGTGGVVITGQTQHGNAPQMPSRMAADQVTAAFADGRDLTAAVGTGHALLEQTTASGARQTTSGDRIEASFAPPSPRGSPSPAETSVRTAPGIGSTVGSNSGEQIQSATVDGHVVLVQQTATKPGVPAEVPLRATAGRAVYDSAGEWLHLTIGPRVDDGGLQLTANKIDVSQGSGDAFAHGDVKATWEQTPAGKAGAPAKTGGGAAMETMTLGGQGPVHVVAAEARVHQATGEVTFRGQARLWQQANSIAAPVLVLDRTRQTLVARSTSAADPVRVDMLSAGGADLGKSGHSGSPTLSAESAERMGHGTNVAQQTGPGTTVGRPEAAHGSAPTVIRVRGGDLKYSEAERKAVMHGGAAGSVVAETGSATSVSNELVLVLLPPGNHAGKDGGAAQVDRMTASGRVSISSQGRRGTGERLVYSSENDEYVLTGTAANPPRLTDPGRGTLTGESLIFNSRDDRVSIEGGGGRKTTTETVAPK